MIEELINMQHAVMQCTESDNDSLYIIDIKQLIKVSCLFKFTLLVIYFKVIQLLVKISS